MAPCDNCCGRDDDRWSPPRTDLSAQEQPALRSRAFHVSSRKQQLPLPRRTTTQLRRSQCSEPYPCLHRDNVAVGARKKRNAPAVEVSRHPHAGARAATRSRLSPHARLRQCTAREKSFTANLETT